MNKKPRQLDTVKILKPVSGTTEVLNDKVRFPVGTIGTVLDIYPDSYLIEILWQPTPLTDDGLLVWLKEDEIELYWRYGDPLPRDSPPPSAFGEKIQ